MKVKKNYVDVGFDATFRNPTILKVENEMKKLGNFDKNIIIEIKNYDDSSFGTIILILELITFLLILILIIIEDNTGNNPDLNKFDLPINFLSNMFDGKRY